MTATALNNCRSRLPRIAIMLNIRRTVHRKTSSTRLHHCPDPSVDSSRVQYYISSNFASYLLGSIFNSSLTLILALLFRSVINIRCTFPELCINDGLNNSRHCTAFRPMMSLCSGYSCSSDEALQGLISEKMCLLQAQKKKQTRLNLREAKQRHKVCLLLWTNKGAEQGQRLHCISKM